MWWNGLDTEGEQNTTHQKDVIVRSGGSKGDGEIKEMEGGSERGFNS